ncbi:hypothetical protein [Streptomyces thioluteus]|uniref:hypothetical protein n=1 Tax=Streptomyces thioluteus TaxID=66431 RepID=UPI0031E9D564
MFRAFVDEGTGGRQAPLRPPGPSGGLLRSARGPDRRVIVAIVVVATVAWVALA